MPSGIPESALYKYRCHYVVENYGKLVLQQCIEWLNAGTSETFKARLLATPQFSETKYKREFNVEQRLKIENGSLDQFDITLCYKILQRVCGLAPLTDDSWTRAGPQGPSLENKIQTIKKIRNELAHDEKTFTEVETRAKVEDLRRTLLEILADVGARANIAQDVVAKNILKMNHGIGNVCEKIREPLDSTDITHFHQLQEEARAFKVQLKDDWLKMVSEEMSAMFNKLSKIEPAPWALHLKYGANPTQVYVRVKVRKDCNLRASRTNEPAAEIPCEDILRLTTHAGDLPDVIVLSGEGGKGKTSLLKYFLEEYLKGEKCAVRNLCGTEMLLHVEARNDQIKTLKGLLMSYAPKAYAHMAVSYEHLSDILLQVEKIILIDGFDEHNPSSRKLVKELLGLPGRNRFIITTRPNSVEDINMIIPESKSKLNLQLQGIPEELHEQFVTKLLSVLVSEAEIAHNTRELMKCLKTLKYTLGEQLNTPLTLALIVLLHVESPETMTNLTSSSVLYEELRGMMTEKLVFRLVTTSDLSESSAKKKCSKFLQHFDQLSFKTFCMREFELRSNTAERLTEVCNDLELSEVEDLVLSSYLNTKRSSRGVRTIKIYTYQHMMMQEFAAGKYLARKVISLLEKKQFSHEPSERNVTSQINAHNDVHSEDSPAEVIDDFQGNMRFFSGLSSERAVQRTRPELLPLHGKLSESTNVIWRVFMEEYRQLALWDDYAKSDFIFRSQNVLMFMIGTIRAEYEELLDCLAGDIMQLVDDEKTNTGQPYIDILLRLVAESGNNDAITKLVSKEIDQGPKDKYCIIKNNSLNMFQNILRFATPEMIAIDIYGDPQDVPDLLPTLEMIATKKTKLSLVLRHHYHDGRGGDSSQFLLPLCNSSSCELAEFWGALDDDGLELLPQCLGVLCLRLEPDQVAALNVNLARLTKLWSLATVVNVHHRPLPRSLSPLQFGGERLVLVVVADIRGEEVEEVQWAIQVLDAVCPPARSRQIDLIGFWETRLTGRGAEALLYRLHEHGFGVKEFVAVRSSLAFDQAEQDQLTSVAQQLGYNRVLVIKDL